MGLRAGLRGKLRAVRALAFAAAVAWAPAGSALTFPADGSELLFNFDFTNDAHPPPPYSFVTYAFDLLNYGHPADAVLTGRVYAGLDGTGEMSPASWHVEGPFPSLPVFVTAFWADLLSNPEYTDGQFSIGLSATSGNSDMIRVYATGLDALGNAINIQGIPVSEPPAWTLAALCLAALCFANRRRAMYTGRVADKMPLA